ncbi:MAG: TIM barrel protein [Bauldia sp.]|nr:MAG: TIM barrel protein [Bauldia sp.]
MPRFSANLGFLWPDQPLLDRIDAAAAAGFKAIELHWPYDVPAERVREACVRHGLALLGINTAVGEAGKDLGLGAVPGREEEFAAAIDQSVAYCIASGAIAIHAMAGKVPPQQFDEGRAVLIRNLERAAPQAAEHGLTLLLEPLNQRDAPGYFYSALEPAADIIAAVGAPNLKIMFDVYHVGVSQGDVLKRLERFMPIIGHVQIAAVPSRAEPDEGEIAYPAIFAALDALGYAGWVGAEYKPRAGTDEGLGWVEALGVRL